MPHAFSDHPVGFAATPPKEGNLLIDYVIPLLWRGADPGGGVVWPQNAVVVIKLD